MERTYIVKIFDGKYTSVYVTKDTNGVDAENRIRKYHLAFGGTIEKITTTEERS